jgi:predicted metal-dependent hydrolase
MNRAVRHRLADLLLGAFGDPAKRDAILRLALYLDLCAGQRLPRISVCDLGAAWTRRYPELAAHSWSSAEATAELKGILEVRGFARAAEHGVQASKSQDSVTPWYEPHADLLPFLAAAGERVRIYAQVVRQAAAQTSTFEQLELLHRGVAEAAICFTAGLFFEAHEHLEHRWHQLPPTPTKRFVQGIIQISVGFHHAMRGSYQGAVNQLGKGLEKLAEAPGDALGLDRDRFLRDVEAARQDMIARGRQRMRQVALPELPRMHLLR